MRTARSRIVSHCNGITLVSSGLKIDVFAQSNTLGRIGVKLHYHQDQSYILVLFMEILAKAVMYNFGILSNATKCNV